MTGFSSQTNTNEVQTKAPGLNLKLKMIGAENMELIK